MITLKDIAKKAGVNSSTVSKALRGSSDINQSTIAKIRSIAEDLGYPKEKYSSYVTDSKTIGAILPELGSQYYCDIYDSFRKKMTNAGYTVLSMLTDFSVEKEIEGLNYFINNEVCGIFFLTESNHNLNQIKNLMEATTAKSVIVSYMEGVDFCDSISVNHATGVMIALNHLIQLGHKRIAFLGEPQTTIRENAFINTMHNLNLDVNSENVVIDEHRFANSGYFGMKSLLSQPEIPTAVLAAYDDLAYGAMKAINEAGLRIPEDISIVGINNNTVSNYTNPPLTSIDNPAKDVGDMAAVLMLERIKGKRTPYQTVLLCPKLNERESTRHITKI